MTGGRTSPRPLAHRLQPISFDQERERLVQRVGLPHARQVLFVGRALELAGVHPLELMAQDQARERGSIALDQRQRRIAEHPQRRGLGILVDEFRDRGDRRGADGARFRPASVGPSGQFRHERQPKNHATELAAEAFVQSRSFVPSIPIGAFKLLEHVSCGAIERERDSNIAAILINSPAQAVEPIIERRQRRIVAAAPGPLVTGAIRPSPKEACH